MNSKIKKFLIKKSHELISILIAITLWEYIAIYIVKYERFLPPFSTILLAFFDVVNTGIVFIDIKISLMHFLLGLVSAILIGVPIGLVVGWFDIANAFLNPLIQIIRPIPPLAWIPFALLWFGLTPLAAGFIVFIGAIFPIIINTYSGVKSVPIVYIEAAKILECRSNLKLIWNIVIPSALPSIASGIRIAMGVGWMCIVAAEMFGVSTHGLGEKIHWHGFLFRMDYTFMYMLVLGFVGLFIDWAFKYFIDNYFLKWQKGVVA